jgi:hypothetical protein
VRYTECASWLLDQGFWRDMRARRWAISNINRDIVYSVTINSQMQARKHAGSVIGCQGGRRPVSQRCIEARHASESFQ